MAFPRDSRTRLAFVTFLTFARFPLVLLFFAGAIAHAFIPSGPLFCATFAALILSAVTDLLDGYFARRFNVVTHLGAHADPLMDKFFYLASLPLLVFVAGREPARPVHATVLLVLTLVFLARDQWVSFLRSMGALYNVSGAAHWSGKVRTAVMFPVICAIYLFEESPWPLPWLPIGLVYLLESVCLAVTVISLFTYTRHYWPSIVRAAQPRGPGGDA